MMFSMRFRCRFASFLTLLSTIMGSPIFALVLTPPNRIKLSSTRLFYSNDKNQSQRKQHHRVMTIPVLGPIPGGKPLMVGGDAVLEQPTSMQWDVLQESFYNHRTYLEQQQQQNQEMGAATGPAGIDAAPLVAFMDEYTSLAPLEGDLKNAKYATIAAVVGLGGSSSNSNTTLESNNRLDTSSNTGFMESIMRVFRPDDNRIKPLESTIRLVGIGRAALSDFHSRLPSTYYEDHNDEDGYINMQQQQQQQRDNEETWAPQQPPVEAPTPIVLAQFRLLSDTGARSEGFVNTFGRSQYASPIHALNEMSCLSNRITLIHEDRKRLVRGLQAAKARLAVASPSVLEDVDGLGMLSGGGFPVGTNSNKIINNPQIITQQEDIDKLLHDFPGDKDIGRASFSSSSFGPNNHEKLLDMENYGMGISSASYSQIPSLTRNLAEKLQPYYSPEKQESEEHYYEVFSFMGVLSLSKFVEASDLNWALKCTNTIERLQWVSDWMRSHKQVLQDASEEVSAELRDCGEECTDLW